MAGSRSLGQLKLQIHGRGLSVAAGNKMEIAGTDSRRDCARVYVFDGTSRSLPPSSSRYCSVRVLYFDGHLEDNAGNKSL